MHHSLHDYLNENRDESAEADEDFYDELDHEYEDASQGGAGFGGFDEDPEGW